MKKVLTILFSLMAALTFAEAVRHVEFQLPSIAKNWEIGNQFQNEEESAVIYIPKGIKKEDGADEFFAVNSTNAPSDVNDIESIKAGFAKMYPNLNIDFKVIERTPEGVIYEWSVKENGQEKVHGWARAFSGTKGTVLLTYQTVNMTDVEKARTHWLPVLKEARILR